MRKLILALALVAFATGASAQVAQNNVSGNECWNAGQGPGGPSNFLCINLVRNGTAMNVISGSGTVNTAATQANSTLLWSGAAPTAWNITLPNPAFDGEVVTVATDTTLSTLVSVTALTTPQNQTMGAAFTSQTVNANSSAEWQFSFPLLKWIKIR